MKKRLLLLVPCILLLLGFLTACTGGTVSGQTAEQKLAGTTWTGEIEDESDVNGLIDIDLPFDMGKLITLRFDSDGTGSLKILNQTQNFTWNVNGNQVILNFDFFGKRAMNFYLDGDKLVLRGTGININLSH